MSVRLAPGARIAGFTLESVLGEGATGSVFLASSPPFGRVALKVLTPVFAEDERFRRRFLRETRLAAELDIPGSSRSSRPARTTASCTWRCVSSTASTCAHS